MVILSHLLDLLQCLLHEEIAMLSIKLLLLIDESEKEDVVSLGLEVNDALNIFGVVIELHSDVHVLSLLNLDDHEHVSVILFHSMGELAAAESVSVVFDHTLDMSLTGDLVLVILIEVVAPALQGNLLGRHLLSIATILITHDHALLLWQRTDVAGLCDVVLIAVDFNLVVSCDHIRLVDVNV